MDTAQWPQEIVVKAMEEIIPNSSKPNCVERKLKEQALNCPRCNSTNTKFCYYNNYSLSQPRYFCKTCRRYWTEGGTLRNIPVGGASRKNKRSSSISSPYNNNNNPLKKLPPLHQHHDQNPSKIIHEEGSKDLNLGFSSHFKNITELIQVPNYDGSNKDSISSLPTPPPPSSSPSQLSSMEVINGITSRGLNDSFMTMPISESNSVYNSFGFSLPSLNFSLDHDGLGNNNVQETNTSGRFLFPFVGVKQISRTNNNTSDGANEHNRDQHHQPLGDQSTNGYWNGMLRGGGGSW